MKQILWTILVGFMLVSCRSRPSSQLSARASQLHPDDIVFVYKLSENRVSQFYCVVDELTQADLSSCSKREMSMDYVLLRKHIVKSIKKESRSSALKKKFHGDQFSKLSKKGSNLPRSAEIRKAFHWQEMRYYQQRRELIRDELDWLVDLDQTLSQGLAFVESSKAKIQFSQNPLAERMRTIFFREKSVFQSPESGDWRFVSNDATFFGASKVCERFFPGYRLPSSAEAAKAIQDGLSDSSFRYALKLHYPQYSNMQSFWTSDLPKSDAHTEQFDKVKFMGKRAWAQAFNQGGEKGQLLLMNFRSSLFCIK